MDKLKNLEKSQKVANKQIEDLKKEKEDLNEFVKSLQKDND